MRNAIRFAVCALLVTAAIAPGTAAAAVQGAPTIHNYSATSCVHPGGTVTARATIGPGAFEGFYAWAQLHVSYLGVPVASSPPVGPYQVGAEEGGYSFSWQATVPWYAPWGPYNVQLTIGPSQQDPSSYDSQNATVMVSPIFC